MGRTNAQAADGFTSKRTGQAPTPRVARPLMASLHQAACSLHVDVPPMSHNASRTALNHLRAHVALLLLICSLPSYAQGQGSYGGIAGGLFSLALGVVLVAVVIVLLGIRATLGNRAAGIVLAALAAGVGYLIVDGRLESAKRQTSYAKIERAFAEGCVESSRTIEHPAKGSERIFIRLHGVESVPEFHRIGLVPQQDRVAEGVAIVTDLPSDVADAIVVDIRYSRELLPGSYPGYEFHRTRYSVKAVSLPAGVLVAHTLDMQARNDFCIGNLDGFLRQALRRPAVMWAPTSGHDAPARVVPPTAYVPAVYTDSTSGKYLQSTRVRDPLEDAKRLLSGKNCSIKDSTISPPMALCGAAPQGAVEVPLGAILGVYAHGDSWLLVYRQHKGMRPLTSLRIEHRLADWRLARVWHANMVPPAGSVEEGAQLTEFAVDGDSMSAAVYWDAKWDSSGSQISIWYAKRSLLRVPLPGLGS